jgi:integrase
VDTTLKGRIPQVGHSRAGREGLAPEFLARIRSVIDPAAQNNPWKNRDARIRNELLIRWLLDLGERHGELLSVRLEDVDLGRCEARIVRRPDSADDPRRRQPTVKTHGRPLPLEGLEDLTERYVFDVRSRIPNAATHPFLFVEVRSGRPLSSSGLAKIVRQLGMAIGCPRILTPHVFRHSWNDAFSRGADHAGLSEQAETDTRNFLQGWSEGSKTAQVYTRRHVREAASAALRSMNARLLEKGRVP